MNSAEPLPPDFVAQDLYRRREIERAVAGVGGYRHQSLALFEFLVGQAAGFVAEHQRHFGARRFGEDAGRGFAGREDPGDDVAAARRYVAHAVGTTAVDDDLLADCIVSCAADLFNMRDARLGVMDVGDSTVEPFRISTDPLRSVWPKLRAAGVLTGGMVIA